MNKLRNLLTMSALRQSLVLTSIFMVILVLFAVATQLVLKQKLEQGINTELTTQSSLFAEELTYSGKTSPSIRDLETNRFSGIIADYQNASGELLIGEFNADIFDHMGMTDIDELHLFNNQSDYWLGVDIGALQKELESAEIAGNSEDNLATLQELDATFTEDDILNQNLPWRVHVTTLGNGRLAVATPLDNISIIDTTLPLALLLSGALMAAITLAGGIFFGLRAQRRMSRLSKQLQQIANGDLSIRLAPNNPKDDLDQLTLRIDQTTERLDQLMSEIKNLSVNLAHEMKTPLARLHASLQQGLAGQSLNATAFENALDEANKINTIFDTILRISRLNAGQNQRAFAPIHLGELAAEVADTFSVVVEEKGRTLQLDIHDSAIIQGDKSAITQAIANLLQNAIVHTPKQTDIILRVQQNQLSVADHGEGISETNRAEVLKPMARLDQSRTTPGNGLGLALVNAITKLHNAKLQLSHTKPTAPHGLTVTLTFPTA